MGPVSKAPTHNLTNTAEIPIWERWSDSCKKGEPEPRYQCQAQATLLAHNPPHRLSDKSGDIHQVSRLANETDNNEEIILKNFNKQNNNKKVIT